MCMWYKYIYISYTWCTCMIYTYITHMYEIYIHLVSWHTCECGRIHMCMYYQYMCLWCKYMCMWYKCGHIYIFVGRITYIRAGCIMAHIQMRQIWHTIEKKVMALKPGAGPSSWDKCMCRTYMCVGCNMAHITFRHIWRTHNKESWHSPPKNWLIALWPSTNGSIPDF